MLVLAGALAGLPALAQEDATTAVGRAIADTLPSTWRVAANEAGGDSVDATLVVPAGWRGSPVSAGLNACPGRESSVWRSVRLVRITVLANGRRTAAIECRQA